MTRQGWRYFCCDKCGSRWKTSSRDAASPSLDECDICRERGCDHTELSPTGYEIDPTVKVSRSGNLLKHETIYLS